MRFRTGQRSVAALVVAVVGTLLTVSCGSPEYNYVANSDDRTYVRLPVAWQAVDETELATSLGLDPSLTADEQGIWLEGYDADQLPSSTHLLGPHAPAPTGLLLVQDVPQPMRGQYSLDRLRDLFQPTSASGRQQLASNPGTALSDFALLADEVLTPGDGIRGVHVVYRYRVAGGPMQVFDKTAYVNDDASKLYVFVARCSSECYGQRQQEIERVVSSFTVLEGS
ncbi:hypothetical protein [Pseudonocardia abyssalis]|uniref:Lipoprotein n=1 Tax=Pseudonocardia abyssalis TaxID=2792008 RepID=A0ABS6UZ18_9PSEU|nr:hypothetical protein [Pseudonocardia abyssalis]MBW0118686.1 hypothetical protein [Pseudonocardia abyssalis]MBW0137491.1 hypothetical protein [Pseudonocardia abyssalis]